MNRLAILGALFLASVASAQEGVETDLELLSRVKPGDGASYVAVRDRILSAGVGGLPVLRRQADETNWTEQGWKRALTAEAARIRLENPRLAAQVDSPRGLDPAVYRTFRKPEPQCVPDLVHAGKEVVPLLMERWLWTYGRTRFSAGPDGALESETLRRAILLVPGQLEDRRARFFLENILADGGAAVAWRQLAAVSLGQCAGLECLATLDRMAGDRQEPVDVREACARALGRIPDPAALAAIRALLSGEPEPPVYRSLVTALGLLGSAWGWEARGARLASTATSVRAGCASLLINELKQRVVESDAIGQSLVMTAWPDSLADLRALAADGSQDGRVRRAAESIHGDLQRALKTR